MFESRFNFTVEDNIAGTIYTTKKKNKKLNILVYVLLSLGVLFAVISIVLDVLEGNNFFSDIFLIIVAIVVGVIVYFSPKFWKKSAIKTYQETIAPNSYCVVTFDEDCCKVAFYKEQEEVSKIVLDLNQITAGFEDSERLVVVFNKGQFVVVKKEYLKGELNELKDLIERHLVDSEIEYMTKKSFD